MRDKVGLNAKKLPKRKKSVFGCFCAALKSDSMHFRWNGIADNSGLAARKGAIDLARVTFPDRWRRRGVFFPFVGSDKYCFSVD